MAEGCLGSSQAFWRTKWTLPRPAEDVKGSPGHPGISELLPRKQILTTDYGKLARRTQT